MKQIPLCSKSGRIVGFALVDDEDYHRVSKYPWYLGVNGYCMATIGPRKARVTLYLQRIVLGLSPKDKRVADHINRVKLDCRRENLRPIKKKYNSFARIQLREAEAKKSQSLIDSQSHVGIQTAKVSLTPTTFQRVTSLSNGVP